MERLKGSGKAMPINVRIIHAKDFITATALGTLSFEESKKALVDIATAAGPLADYEILLDTREVESDLSITDLWYLAAELATLGGTFRHKTAVLCPLVRFEDASFFATCALNRSFQVRGFISFEDAIAWLTEPPDRDEQQPSEAAETRERVGEMQ
jgi:hypothetical protein